jgi:hypothetical protein
VAVGLQFTVNSVTPAKEYVTRSPPEGRTPPPEGRTPREVDLRVSVSPVSLQLSSASVRALCELAALVLQEQQSLTAESHLSGRSSSPPQTPVLAMSPESPQAACLTRFALHARMTSLVVAVRNDAYPSGELQLETSDLTVTNVQTWFSCYTGYKLYGLYSLRLSLEKGLTTITPTDCLHHC